MKNNINNEIITGESNELEEDNDIKEKDEWYEQVIVDLFCLPECSDEYVLNEEIEGKEDFTNAEYYKSVRLPGFCKDAFKKPGMHCLHNKCKHLCVDEELNIFAYANKSSRVIDSIAFGGEMRPEDFSLEDKYSALWERICSKKMNEAYDEYMKEKERMENAKDID